MKKITFYEAVFILALIFTFIMAQTGKAQAPCQFDTDITKLDTIQLDSLFRSEQQTLLKLQQKEIYCKGNCFDNEMRCQERKMHLILERRKAITTAK